MSAFVCRASKMEALSALSAFVCRASKMEALSR